VPHEDGHIDRPSSDPAPVQAAIRVVVVHYRSGGMLSDLLLDLAGQSGVDAAIHVVECGDDGSIAKAQTGHSFEVVSEGENLGYCGGNNLMIRKMLNSESPICLINPDVRLPDQGILRGLFDALQNDTTLAAVAPSIIVDGGKIEYTDSKVDLAHAFAAHIGTHVAAWPSDAPPLVEMTWIDGACLMLRPKALRDIGVFDERFFLFSEDVDWCVRAGQLGWKVGVLREVEVRHTRSSSFGASSKGAYYAWRNTYLLCKKYEGYGTWIFAWLRRLLKFVRTRRNVRSGQSMAALRGSRDAIIGRTGRMPGDA
jgi:GT2 family glycosyltransferase